LRITNSAGRLTIVSGERAVDVEAASGGAFSADVHLAYERWDELRTWAGTLGENAFETVPGAMIGPPSPRPSQIFAVGLNYREHAAEGGIALPESPMIFTKFPASVAGPFGTITLPEGSVDFEAELVVVIGRRAYEVPENDAWSYVAGLTVGQDISERQLQLQPPVPQQFSLAKSYPGFAPLGPVLVTPDELDDPDDLELGCLLNGEQMQQAWTSEMIFPVPRLVAYLSSILPLFPGDLIFTGTPSGIGWVRDPKRLLHEGDELVTYVDGIGSMRHSFRSVRRPVAAAVSDPE
jgi:2-keto-4-pentenoate hydratase/2-oxohepta-3-ene-1,7-dioic acid hydratase in catechol pathway